MSEIIRQKDPRGVVVYCEESQWNNHIILNHPIMCGNESSVAETIEEPMTIYESHDSDPPMGYREIYCKETPSATYYSKGLRFTKVVVSTIGGSGEVVTAFPSKSAMGGSIGDAIYIDNEQIPN